MVSPTQARSPGHLTGDGLLITLCLWAISSWAKKVKCQCLQMLLITSPKLLNKVSLTTSQSPLQVKVVRLTPMILVYPFGNGLQEPVMAVLTPDKLSFNVDMAKRSTTPLPNALLVTVKARAVTPASLGNERSCPSKRKKKTTRVSNSSALY